MWRECKRCHKKLLVIKNQPLPHDGYCEACYEAVTGNCAACEGTGQIQRAHLGTMECPKCEGTGRAEQA
jgi:hypothetical protein